MNINYFHKQAVSILSIAIVALSMVLPATSIGGRIEPVDRTVQHLITHVAGSDLTFFRNSGQYTGKEASEHMQKKYEHFRNKIKTPEDFIELCATRSLLSGKPYQVINEQGEKISTSEWLIAELERYRNSSPGDSH